MATRSRTTGRWSWLAIPPSRRSTWNIMRAFLLTTSLTRLDSHPSKKAVDGVLGAVRQRVEHNQREQSQRRSAFLRSLMVLAVDGSNASSASVWKRLGLD